jgi:hypothetical protein
MTHPIPSARPSGRRTTVLLLAAVFLGAAGCAQIQPRGQAAEDPEAKFDLKEVLTVGDVTDVANAAPLQVSGVGLVKGLDGTGGAAPPSEFRGLLEQQLLKQGVRDVKRELESPENAMVLLTAVIPPGARKGDPLDIQVTLPVGSKVTSLRGGVLKECVLRNYDTSHNLDPAYQGSNKLLPGHILAKARGPLLVGFGPEQDEGMRLRQARIWDGGVSLIDRPFYLELKDDQKFARIANAVAQRINMLFPDDAHKQQEVLRNRRLMMLDEVAGQLNDKFKVPTLGKGETARAVTKDVIYVQVPYGYRLNAERYLRVARLIPLREAPEARGRYRRYLRALLLDPAHTVTAALRLEALGRESIPTLKEGLQSQHTLVRFAAAESLAYLDSGAGADELARLAEQYEALRAYCLMAMASMDAGVSYLRLSELLASPDVTVRYGAFRTLRLFPADEQPAAVLGEMLGESFWLHKVAPKSSPLVHACTSQRAEVVLFGEPARLRPPFKMLAGSEFTITAEPGDDRCTVSRFVLSPPSMARRQCSLRLEDVLRTIAELGGQYPDVVDLLRQVEYRHCLTAPVRFDAVPVIVPVEVLAEEGKTPKLLRPEEDAVADRRRDETPRTESEVRPVTHSVTAGPGTRD